MAGLDDIVKKAFYLGVGAAAYAQEKAGSNLNELRTQAQKLADEMIAKGKITTEEARKLVDDLVRQAQQEVVNPTTESENKEPRQIEIVSEEDEPSQPSSDQVDSLRQQVESLQEELRRLRRE